MSLLSEQISADIRAAMALNSSPPTPKESWDAITGALEPYLAGAGTMVAQYPRGAFGVVGSGTSTLIPGNSIALAFYMGKAEKALTATTIRINVTTAGSGTGHCEIGLATGTVGIGAGASLTRLGYANIQAIAGTTGLKNISVSLGVSPDPNADLWLVISQSWTSISAAFTCCDTADPLSTGYAVTKAATQFSAMSAGSAFSVSNVFRPIVSLYDR